MWTKKNKIRVLLGLLWFFIIMAFYDEKLLIFSIIFMITCHELGHLYAAKYFGIKTDGFTLIPFLGGVAEIKEIPRDRWIYFLVYFWGPFVGFLMSLILAMIGFFIESPQSLLIAGVWAYINFLNLLPVLPLDGGNMKFAIESKEKGYFNTTMFEVFNFLGLCSLWLFTNSILMTGLVLVFSFQQKSVLSNMESNDHFYEDNRNRMNRNRLRASLLFLTLAVSLMLTYMFSFAGYHHLTQLETLKAIL